MGKRILREIKPIERDLRFEYFRAIKTACIIIIIFCIGFIFKHNYINMLENSRYMCFYPATTVFYEDYSDAKDFDKNIKIPNDIKTISYGIFKDDFGEDKFLVVYENQNNEDIPITEKRRYLMFSKKGYTFISNSEDELKNLQKNINVNSYEFIRDKNIKKLIKNLDKKRDYTMIFSDVSYADLPINNDASKLLNKIFDKASVQIFKNENGYEFLGEITFKNKIANLATGIKNLSKNFDTRKIKIEKFDNNNMVMILGVKDFDLWSKAIINIAKTLPENQYNNTVKFIQTIFNSDIEEDIIQKLNGNAVFYLFNERRTLHPMLILETKKDLAQQAQKYLNFLQISSNLSLSEKELKHHTFNVLKSGFYPYNLSFGTIDESMFILGHQSIIEKYLELNNLEKIEEDCDFYLYSNVIKTPVFSKNRGFWRGYKNMELKIYLSPNLNFAGRLEK